MKKKCSKERRMAQRIKVPLRVKYKILNRLNIMEENITQDVSGTGYKMLLKRHCPKGQKVKTLLYFPLDKKPVLAISEVAWSKGIVKEGKAFYEVGLKHIKILPKDRDRFVFLFCEMMVNFFTLGKIIE